MSIAPNKIRKTITIDKDLLTKAMVKGSENFLSTESEVISEALRLYVLHNRKLSILDLLKEEPKKD